MALIVLAETAGSASPLRDEISVLACGDREARAGALTRLDDAPRGALGLPDESLAMPAIEVHGHVIDRLLEVLSEARRDPELAPRIDALVASWNYCAITADERVWDVRLEDGTLHRAQQAYPSTVAGRGFTAWGLIPRLAGGRPVTTPGESSATCDVATVSEMPWGSIGELRAAIGFDPTCDRPPARAVPVVAAITRPAEQARARARAETLRPAAHPPPRELGDLASHAGVVAPHVRGVSASMFARQSLAGKLDTGTLLSWSPRSSTFVRTGATWQLGRAFSADASATPTWSLGLGYDDWHPGTWSFQVNQWGSVVPGDGWSIVRTAAAELAYKVRLGAALGRHLGLKLALSSKLSWGPAAGVSVSVKLPRAGFASIGASTTGGHPTWTYVLGRSTWMPGSLSIIFANFGPNSLPRPNLIAHSALTASWSWAW